MRKFFFFLIFLLFLGFLILGFLIWQAIYLSRESVSQREVIFEIKKGESGKEIGKNLKKEGLIKSENLFTLYNLFKGTANKLKAGKYLLSPSLNIPQITQKFILAQRIKEEIKFLEGWDLKDAANYLEEKGICQSEEFIELSKKDFSDKFDFLKEKPKDLSLEGYLFPDTYEILSGVSCQEIIQMMLKNFDKNLTPQLKQDIENQKKTIFEIITMASLIEKEVRTLEDKKLVSGILWKRLKIGMPLQVDATINYITGKKTSKIFLDELKIDSPYNTYKYLGLPLGPICNPGIDSIEAAIYPKDNEYWYYLSTPEGKTIFSKTLKEHNLARAKYLK